MIKVEPIRNEETIQCIKKYLKNRNIKYYFLFCIGINAPLKTEELVQLQVKDVIPPVFRTANDFEIVLPEYLQNELTDYIRAADLKSSDFLFCSERTNRPYTRQQLHRILSDTSHSLSIGLHIGAQSLKKTFAYHAYKRGMDITELQHLLGHQSKRMTYQFIDLSPMRSSTVQLNL